MIAHGVDGWDLVEMEWDFDTGVATCWYEKDGEIRAVRRPQPVTFTHEGWWSRDRSERTLEFTERDWSRIERGLYNDPVEYYEW